MSHLGKLSCVVVGLALATVQCQGTAVDGDTAPAGDAGALDSTADWDTLVPEAESRDVADSSESPEDASELDGAGDAMTLADTGAVDGAESLRPDGCPVKEQGSTDSCEGFPLAKSCSYGNDPLYGEVTCTCTADGPGPIWICYMAGTEQEVCPSHTLPEPCSDYHVFNGCFRKGSLDVYCVCSSFGWNCYA